MCVCVCVWARARKKKNHKINTKKKPKISLIFFRGWVQLGPCGWVEPSRPSWVTSPNQ